MVSIMDQDSSTEEPLLRRAADGDQESWAALLNRHRERLRRMVAFRLDHRLAGRLDPSDVVQETFLEAWQQLAKYLRRGQELGASLATPAIPFFLWLRGIAGNKLRELHRRHLGTHMRDAGREVSLYRGTLPETTSAALAAQLLGHVTRPSEAAVRAEIKIRLQEALNSMDLLDREVLALRHFEQLSPAETAQVLGIKEKAAGMRYVRALRRLKEILSGLPGGLTDFRR
jgi:RNA polymerase sigma-70 factor (ECF subfamily)